MHRVLPAVILLTLACGGGEDTAAPPELFQVTINGVGSGAGRVVATEGATLDCVIGGQGQTCQATIEEATQLSVEATPDEFSIFTGWQADASACGTTPNCSLTVDRVLTLTAGFERAFPAVAGVYSVTGEFDGIPVRDASFSGTLVLEQASRTAGPLTGSAEFVVRIENQVLRVRDNELRSASVSPMGVISFTVVDEVTWTFTGVYSSNSITNGRHTLATRSGLASGSWSGTQSTGSLKARGLEVTEVPRLLRR